MGILLERDNYRELNNIYLGHSPIFIKNIEVKLGRKIAEIHERIGGKVVYMTDANMEKVSDGYEIYADFSYKKPQGKYVDITLSFIENNIINEIISEEEVLLEEKRKMVKEAIKKKKAAQ